MEIRHHLLHLLLWTLLSCGSSQGPSSSTSTGSGVPKRVSIFSSLAASSSSSSSSSNEVYPEALNASLEFLKEAYLIKEMLTDEDRSFDVKILPHGREVSTHMFMGEVKRLLFPLIEEGPLTFIVTPCASPLSWTLTLRPRDIQDVENNEKILSLTNNRDINRTSGYYDSSSYYEKVRRRIKNRRKLSRSAPDPIRQESIVSQVNNKRSNTTKRKVSEFVSDETQDHNTRLSSSEQKWKADKNEKQRTHDDIATGVPHDDEENNAAFLKNHSVKIDDHKKGVLNQISISSESDLPQNDDAWTSGFSRRHNVRRNGIILKSYKGYDSIIFQQQSLPPGLYVLQVQALSGPTHVHVQVKKDWVPPPATAHVSAVKSFKTKGIMLRWASSTAGTGYCLVVSEGRPYPSLCAAREAREGTYQASVLRNPKPQFRYSSRQSYQSRPALKNPMLLLGCTDHNWFRLSSPPARTLHIAVWEAGVGGPPLGRGVVRPSKRAKVPRVRPGELMTLVPSAGGRAAVKFKVRRRGRRLHVMAVACGAELKLRVETRHGRRIASARGEQGALHMILRDLPPATMTLALRTNPPGASNSILVTAAHSTRSLPLPRLPRNNKVRVSNITCSSAIVKWSKAGGNSSYCVLVEEVNRGQVWRERAPRQCGWETLLEKKGLYVDKWCGQPSIPKKPDYTANKLFPSTTYTVTVLVQHNLTGRFLSLPPVRFTAPNCTLI